jgi:MFS family permease
VTSASEVRPAPTGTPDPAGVQRRTLRLLFGTQIVGGIGVTIGISVGALLAARLVGTGLSGVAQSCAVVGAALLAVPVTRLMQTRGRRPGLVLAYLTGATGAVLVVLAALTRAAPLLFAGLLLFGGGTTANLQARYTAVDLAEPARRGRQLSVIVWATTVGSVTAPMLAAPADAAFTRAGLPALSGPFAVSAAAFLLAGLVLFALLRPDPLLTARRLAALPAGPAGPTGPAAPAGPGSPARAGGMREALSAVAARPAARLGVTAVAVGHLAMVGVMSMTPVHLGEWHADADVLPLVGLVLSLHIAGMYALAPLVGWLTDRLGRRQVVLGGAATLLAACALAGAAGHHTPRLAAGLVLLGLGWSGTMVAGSTLLSESVPVAVRPAAQGLSDVLMGLAGAAAAALGGPVVRYAGYPVLTALAALAVVPLVALALRPVPADAGATDR